MMSKIDQAVEIVKANPEISRGDLIARFIGDLGMTKAGASTYVVNARKKAGIVPTASDPVARKSAARKPVNKANKPTPSTAEPFIVPPPHMKPLTIANATERLLNRTAKGSGIPAAEAVRRMSILADMVHDDTIVKDW